jgi:hypothetical protein
MLVRAGVALALALLVVAQLGPAAAVGAEPTVVASVNKVVAQFAAHGPEGASGFWAWNPQADPATPSARWRFEPVAAWHNQTGAAEPRWPEDVTIVQAIGVTSETGDLLGVWIWNPYRFVGGAPGPVFWSPTWEWHDAQEFDTP